MVGEMTIEQLEAEVEHIISKRYRVLTLDVPVTAHNPNRYAVFTGGVSGNGPPRRVSESTTHAQAQQDRICFIVQDILDLIEKGRR